MKALWIPVIILLLACCNDSLLFAQDWTYVGPGGGNQFYVIDSTTYLVSADHDSELHRYVNGVRTIVYDTESWLHNITDIKADQYGDLYAIVNVFDSRSLHLLKSADLGKTWEASIVHNVCDNPSSLYFIDRYVGFIGGDDSQIFRTDDGGKTWTRVHHGVYTSVAEFAFVNSMVGFAIGGRFIHGFVLKTTDGGKTWGPGGVNCGRFCHTVMFSSPCVAYISSYSDVTRIDLCAGTKKTLETPGQEYGPVHFVNDRVGYLAVADNVIGSEGYYDESEIYITYDAGETWHLQTTPYIIAVPSHFKQHGNKLFLNVGNTTNETPDVVLSTDIPPHEQVVIMDTVIHVSCNGFADGEIHMSIVGGTPPYEIFWADTSLFGTLLLTNLSAGEYSVIVRDSTGLYGGKTWVVSEPTKLQPTYEVRHETNHKANGFIRIYASGGTPPYLYEWSHTDTLHTSEAHGLQAGRYDVTVSDVNGCVGSTEVLLLNHQIYYSDESVVDYEVRPNPVHGGEITLYTRQAVPPSTSYHLLNLAGQELISGAVETRTVPIDLNNLEPGLYLLRVTSESSQFWIRRIIIQ